MKQTIKPPKEQQMKQTEPQKTIITKTVIPAILAMLPLSVSIIPWGILCGTLSIEAGLTSLQAQLMSLLVFAGAAQLSGVTILGAGGTWSALLNSTVMISVRHVLYSATYQQEISQLSFIKRVIFAFLLTDEMFAVSQAEQSKTGIFDYWFSVIAGFSFYVVWNIATFIGIFSAHMLKNIDELGFDFAITATFIAMVVPMVKSKAMLIAVMVSAGIALYLAFINIEQGLIISSVIGMIIGALLNKKNIKEQGHSK